MKKPFIYLYLFAFCFVTQLNSQVMPTNWSAGPELQLYPTGIIPGLRVQKKIDQQSFLSLRVGANIFDHRDLGVQEKEEGDGVGFTIGYHRMLLKSNDHFLIGIKNDVWWNSNEWENSSSSGNPSSGTSNIVVLQPTAELGYRIGSVENSFSIIPTIAFGFEINIKTEGEPVGEGLILLIGLLGQYNF